MLLSVSKCHGLLAREVAGGPLPESKEQEALQGRGQSLTSFSGFSGLTTDRQCTPLFCG